MTAHNPYDFGQVLRSAAREGSETARASGRAPPQIDRGASGRGAVGRVQSSGDARRALLLRQPSRFGAMSRFSTGDLDERLLDGAGRKEEFAGRGAPLAAESEREWAEPAGGAGGEESLP